MKINAWALLLCAPLIQAANPQDAPEVTSHEAPATFTSRVNLVSVPVVVRDSKGHAVGNLRQEDFKLFDKGRQQVIVKFAVQANAVSPARQPISNQPTVSATAPTATVQPLLPDHYIAYIFDDIHTDFGALARTRIAAEQHLASLSPASRAAVFTTSGRVFLDFTDDRDKLREALNRITPGPSALAPTSANLELGRQDACPPDINLYRADRALNALDPVELQAAETAAVACYGRDPSPPTMGRMAAQQVLEAGILDTKTNLSSLENLVHRLAAMPGNRSIVLISSGFFVTSQLRQDESALMDSAIHANVTLNALDARGLFTQNTPQNLALGDTMRELADGTGGKFFENDNGFKQGLDQLATPPEFTYVLGFSPQNLKLDGSYHGLKVSLVNAKGLDIQARRGYWAPNHAAGAAEQSKEEIQEAVFSLEEIRDIPVDVTTEFFKTSDAGAELTVESHLNLNGLKFKTAADRSQDTLTIVTGVFDQNGHYVKGTQRIVDLSLRQPTLDRLLASGMAVQETFELPPGRYVVRVVVRDSQGETMAARNGTVNIQ